MITITHTCTLTQTHTLDDEQTAGMLEHERAIGTHAEGHAKSGFRPG